LKIKIYRIIILPVGLCGCKIWSLTLRGENGLRLFEKRLLKRIFSLRRRKFEVAAEDRILRSFTNNTSNQGRWVGGPCSAPGRNEKFI
jgi:hypothetical protein